MKEWALIKMGIGGRYRKFVGEYKIELLNLKHIFFAFASADCFDQSEIPHLLCNGKCACFFQSEQVADLFFADLSVCFILKKFTISIANSEFTANIRSNERIFGLRRIFSITRGCPKVILLSSPSPDGLSCVFGLSKTRYNY